MSLIKLLKEMNQPKKYNTFKELINDAPEEIQRRVKELWKIEQRLDFHPEGNTLKHTIVVIKRALREDDIDLAISALFHDIGKDSTGKPHPKHGHMTHYGHEFVSADLVKKYADWIEERGGNVANIYYIVKNHMRVKNYNSMKPSKQEKLASFRAFPKLDTFTKKLDGGGYD